MNIKEAARRAGVSARTLRYYEEAGLIAPARGEGNAYREYDEGMLHRVRMIRAYRELQFPVKLIARLLDAPRVERDRLLEQHIEQLKEKQQKLQNRIDLAQSLRMIGPEHMAEIDFAGFDAQMQAARLNMQKNAEFQALSARFKAQSEAQAQAMSEAFLRCLAQIANAEPEDVPAAIGRLRSYVDENLYPCTDQLLRVYARSYGGDGMLAQALEEIAGAGSALRLKERLEAAVCKE